MTISPKALAYLLNLKPGCYARVKLGIDGAATPRRKRIGTGDHAQRKAWLREMAQGPGIFLDWYLPNILNLREHQIKRAGRTEKHRRCVRLKVQHYFNFKMPPLPVRVTITRYGPKVLDSDGLAAACKALRDGIADAWGERTDDRDGVNFYWEPKQELSRFAGVRIEIEALTN